MNFKGKIHSDILEIFSLFNSYKADSIRLVGGCVRDLVDNREVADFDFASTFTPAEIIKILLKHNIKAIPTGIDFGTVTIIFKSKSYEITTLRSEYDYDGRRPKVKFSTDYFEDSKRRDFTINALYIDQNLQLIDYHDGLKDITNKKLKFIGDPKLRILEDHLRILRYFRFLSIYNDQIDQNSLDQSIKNINLISDLSKERVFSEIIKMFNYDPANILKSLEIIKEAGVDNKIFCQYIDITPLKNLDNYNKFNIHSNTHLKLYSIFNNDDQLEFIERFRFPKSFKKYFLAMQRIQPLLNYENINFLIYKYSKDMVIDSVIYSSSCNSNIDIDKLISRIIEIKSTNIPILPISGQDIIDIGHAPGPDIGKAMSKVIKIWCESNFTKNKNDLLKFIKKLQ